MGFAQLTSFADAIAWVDSAFAGKLGPERLSIAEAVGRVLASEVKARTDAPPFDRAVADGYAIDAEATLGASVYNPLPFRIRGSGCSILLAHDASPHTISVETWRHIRSLDPGAFSFGR